MEAHNLQVILVYILISSYSWIQDVCMGVQPYIMYFTYDCFVFLNINLHFLQLFP
jgi:hypothetical protein